jgi:hypothetical protein
MIVDNYTNINQMCSEMKYEFLFYERQTSAIVDPGLSDNTIKVCFNNPKFMWPIWSSFENIFYKNKKNARMLFALQFSSFL